MAILIDFARVVIWECFLETDYIAEELPPSGAMRLVPLFALQIEGLSSPNIGLLEIKQNLGL